MNTFLDILDGVFGVKQTIEEMAVKDLKKPSIANALASGDYKKAAKEYIDIAIASDPKKYAGLTWLEAARKVGKWGITRTISTAISKGEIDKEVGNKFILAVQDAAVHGESEKDKEKRLEIEKQRAQEKEASETAKKERDEKLSSLDEDGKKLVKFEDAIEQIKKQKKTLEWKIKKDIAPYVSSDIPVSPVMADRLKNKADAVEKDFNNYIPSFILQEPLSKKESNKVSNYRFSGKDKGELAKNMFVLKIKAEKFADYLQEIVDNYEIVLDENKGKSSKEILSALNNDTRFIEPFKKVVSFFKVHAPKKEGVKLSAETGRKERTDNRELESLVNQYFNALEDIAKAYDSGKLREYTKNNWGKINTMLLDSKKYMKSNNYKKPNDIDDREIEEDLEESVDEHSLLRGKDLPASIRDIVDTRYNKKTYVNKKTGDTSTEYGFKYSGIERDSPEMNYLFKYGRGDFGNDKTALKILVNIYLDYIDGLDILLRGRNSAALSDKNTVSRQNRIKAVKEVEARKTKGVPPKYERDKYLNGVILDGSGKQKKRAFMVLDKDILSEPEKDELYKKVVATIKSGKANPRAVYEYMVSKVDQIAEKIPLKEMIDFINYEFDTLDSKTKFNNKFFKLNLMRNRYTEDEIKELFKAAFKDETTRELQMKLRNKKFSDLREAN